MDMEINECCSAISFQVNVGTHQDFTKIVIIMFQQYSAGLVQYKNSFLHFGNFDPRDVRKEIKRGNKLVSDN